MENQHVFVLDKAVDDDVLPYREASQARPQIVIALAAQMRIAGQEIKTFGDGIDQTVGNLHAAAFLDNVIPDVVKLRFGSRRQPMRHSAARGLLFTGQAGSATLFHLLCQLAHRVLSDDPAFAARKGSFRDVDSRQNFSAGALALFPHGQGLAQRIFLAAVPPAFYGLANESFLVVSEIHFHLSMLLGSCFQRKG
jgi:hypothetical protein